MAIDRITVRARVSGDSVLDCAGTARRFAPFFRARRHHDDGLASAALFDGARDAVGRSAFGVRFNVRILSQLLRSRNEAHGGGK